MFKFKKDKFANARGGNSVLLDISCQHCGNHICYYQKDGPGELRRMYCDRIIFPSTLVESVQVSNYNDLKPLVCHNCGRLLAVPMIYEKEKRYALRLFVGAVKKTKITLKDFNNLIK